MNILTIKGLKKSYKKREVVSDVNFTIRQGEIVGLLGPNGAGKTTTFYIVVGMVIPEAGEIYLNDERLTDKPMYQRARLGIGYLSQEPSIFRKLTVEENIMAILELFNLTYMEREERKNKLLKEFDILNLAKQRADLLSGGERRRTEIARTLAIEPKFLLLDEPFAGIDPIAVLEIQKIIGRLKNKGLGILITDHNVRETLKITDKSYIMYEGKILISGTSEELLNNEQARKIYLGEQFTM